VSAAVRAGARVEPALPLWSLWVWTPLAVEAWAVRAGDRSLYVERTGMGAERARAAVRRHEPGRASALAVAGLCGAVDLALTPGSVFVADRLETPEGAVLPADGAGLARALRARGMAAHRGTLLGVERVVTGEDRQRLRARGIDAVDMESPWLAAAAAGRPFAVLRVVVDAPGAELYRAGLLRHGLRRTAPALADWARCALLPDEPVATAEATEPR